MILITITFLIAAFIIIIGTVFLGIMMHREFKRNTNQQN